MRQFVDNFWKEWWKFKKNSQRKTIVWHFLHLHQEFETSWSNMKRYIFQQLFTKCRNFKKSCKIDLWVEISIYSNLNFFSKNIASLSKLSCLILKDSMPSKILEILQILRSNVVIIVRFEFCVDIVVLWELQCWIFTVASD